MNTFARFLRQNCFRTVRGTAFSGLLLGLSEVLIYGLVFGIYATVRSSIQIGRVLALQEGLVGTLLANALSLFMAILMFTLLLGIGAAIIEAITLLLVYALSALFNPQGFQTRGLWIGLTTSGVLVAVILGLVQQSLGIYFAALWPSGYFFWLGLPSLLFMSVNGWLSWWFSHDRQMGQKIARPQRSELRTHAAH